MAVNETNLYREKMKPSLRRTIHFCTVISPAQLQCYCRWCLNHIHQCPLSQKLVDSRFISMQSLWHPHMLEHGCASPHHQHWASIWHHLPLIWLKPDVVSHAWGMVGSAAAANEQHKFNINSSICEKLGWSYLPLVVEMLGPGVIWLLAYQFRPTPSNLPFLVIFMYTAGSTCS